jgi:hypothetical protein
MSENEQAETVAPVVSAELVEAIRDIHRLRLENMLLTGMVMGLALALWISRERTSF